MTAAIAVVTWAGLVILAPIAALAWRSHCKHRTRRAGHRRRPH